MCSQYFDSVNIHLNYTVHTALITSVAQLIENLQHLPRQNEHCIFEDSKPHPPPYNPCLEHKNILCCKLLHMYLSAKCNQMCTTNHAERDYDML